MVIRFFPSSIRGKLVLSAALSSFIALAVGIITIVYNRILIDSINELCTRKIPIILQIAKIRESLANVNTSDQILLNRRLGDQKIRTDAHMVITDSQAHLDDARENFPSLSLSSKEQDIWKQFSQALEVWEKQHKEFMDSIEEMETFINDGVFGGRLFTLVADQIHELSFGTMRIAREKVLDELRRLNESIEGSVNTARLDATSRADWIRWIMVVFVAAAFVVLLITGVEAERLDP